MRDVAVLRTIIEAQVAAVRLLWRSCATCSPADLVWISTFVFLSPDSLLGFTLISI